MATMLAGVIGVDTHRDSHTAAVVNAATGGVIEHLSVATDAFGYRRLQASRTPLPPAGGYGRSKEPEATVTARQRRCWNTANGSWRSTGPRAPHDETAQSQATSTLSAPREKRSAAITSLRHIPVVIAKRCGCWSRRGKEPSSAARKRSVC